MPFSGSCLGQTVGMSAALDHLSIATVRNAHPMLAPCPLAPFRLSARDAECPKAAGRSKTACIVSPTGGWARQRHHFAALNTHAICPTLHSLGYQEHFLILWACQNNASVMSCRCHKLPGPDYSWRRHRDAVQPGEGGRLLCGKHASAKAAGMMWCASVLAFCQHSACAQPVGAVLLGVRDWPATGQG
jgi:hypothetical protein